MRDRSHRAQRTKCDASAEKRCAPLRAHERFADAIADDAEWNEFAVLRERCVCRELRDRLCNVRPLFREIVVVLTKLGERALQRGDPFRNGARETQGC